MSDVGQLQPLLRGAAPQPLLPALGHINLIHQDTFVVKDFKVGLNNFEKR